MSVALLVKLKRAVALDEIELASSAALKELLNLNDVPGVTARLDASDRVGSQSSVLLTESSNRVVCSLAGHDEKVVVTPFTVPVQVPTNDGSYSFADQDYASIGWQFKKSPLCWALVGAVALGLARGLGSEIEDNAGFFSAVNAQRPEEFFRALRIPTPQVDVELAAAALYAKMPKCSEIAEWLERQPAP
jgi:hypothetical protein